MHPVRTLLVMDWIPRNEPIVDVLLELSLLEIVARAWSEQRLGPALATSRIELALVDCDLVALEPRNACAIIKYRLLAPAVVALAGPLDQAARQLVLDSGADAVVPKALLRELLPGMVGRLVCRRDRAPA